MKELLWLAKMTLTRTFRKKSNWIFLFILPIAGVLFSSMIYGSNSEGTLRIGVVNMDSKGQVAADTVQFLGGLSQVKLTSLSSEATLNEDLASSKLDVGVILDGDFSQQITSGKPGGIHLVSIKGASVTTYVKAMLQNNISNISAMGLASKGDTAHFQSMYEQYRQQMFKLTPVTLANTSVVKNTTYQSLGFLIAFMMFSSVNLTGIILKEKENRTFLRVAISPISSKVYVLSNVLVNFMMIVLQIIITLFMMKNVMHINSGIPFMELLGILLLFGIAAIGLSLMIVSFAKSSGMAGALQNLIITPTCLLAGCYFPVDIMPNSVRKISNFLPQHWLLDTITKLQGGSAFSGLYVNLLILGGFAAAFSLIASYRFSRNNDTRTFV